MPGMGHTAKWWRLYEELRKKYSKASAARIANKALKKKRR